MVAEAVRGPELVAGVERRNFGTYGIVSPPGGGSMLHLEPDEYALLDLLDGTHSAQEIEQRAGGPVDELLADLRSEGFLVDSPASDPPRRATASLHGIEFSGFDRVVQVVNRLVGNLVFSTPGVVILAVTATAGPCAFIIPGHDGSQLTVSVAQPVLAVVVLRVLGFIGVWLHESGHALVIVRNKRRVGRVGVGFYWGSLTFFVDASQALFFGRRTRMLQSSAGVISDLFTCGAASLVAAAGGNASWAVMLREFAVLGYLGVIINAVPLLELDGYWFLADALNRPTLQRDSRRELATAVRGHSAHPALAIYALVSLIFGLFGIAFGIFAWWHLFGGLFHELWNGGLGYKALAVFLVLPYAAMVGHLAAQPFRYLHHRRVQPELVITP